MDPRNLRASAHRLDERQPEDHGDTDYDLFYASRALEAYATLLETPHPNCHVCHAVPEETGGLCVACRTPYDWRKPRRDWRKTRRDSLRSIVVMWAIYLLAWFLLIRFFQSHLSP